MNVNCPKDYSVVDFEFIDCETEMAVLLKIPDHQKKYWFPKSQILSTHTNPDDTGCIVVKSWIVKQKGL